MIFLGCLLFKVEKAHRLEKYKKKIEKFKKKKGNEHEPKEDDTDKTFHDHLSYHNPAYKSEKSLNGDVILLSSAVKERTFSVSTLRDEEKESGFSEEISKEIEIQAKVVNENSEPDVSDISDDNHTLLEHDDVMNYIAINTRTASLSHEGTSFYLRFGLLCRCLFC